MDESYGWQRQRLLVQMKQPPGAFGDVGYRAEGGNLSFPFRAFTALVVTEY